MKPYMIRISSQKGGVGKTAISINIAASLSMRGYKVLVIDEDYANPSVGLDLGIEDTEVGVRSLMQSKAPLNRVAVAHAPTGLQVLPGELTARPFAPTSEEIERLLAQVSGSKFDFAIFDTMPGLPIHTKLEHYNEVIIVAIPEISACASAIKLATVYEKYHLKHSLVVNRVRNAWYELHPDEIEEMYGGRIAALLPEDECVPISNAEHQPVVSLRPRCRFSRAIDKLAQIYSSKA